MHEGIGERQARNINCWINNAFKKKERTKKRNKK